MKLDGDSGPPDTRAFEVVQAGVEHIDLVGNLFDAYLQEFDEPSNVPEAREYIRQRIANLESAVFVALREDRTAIGFCQLYPLFSSAYKKRAWLLNDVYVAPDAREEGVALALLERCHALAEASDAVRVEVVTDTNNRPAQKLYEAAGYSRTTTVYHYIRNTQ